VNNFLAFCFKEERWSKAYFAPFSKNTKKKTVQQQKADQPFLVVLKCNHFFAEEKGETKLYHF